MIKYWKKKCLRLPSTALKRDSTITVEFLLFNLRTFYRIMKQNQYSLVILDDARSTTCRIRLKMQSRRDVDD